MAEKGREQTDAEPCNIGFAVIDKRKWSYRGDSGGIAGLPSASDIFEKFPRIKRALMKDIPGWEKNLQQRIQEAKAPAGLADEFYLYQ